MTPLLTVVKGDARPHMTGRELIAILTPTILEHIHAVPRDDPFRTVLERLARDTERTPAPRPRTPRGAA